MEGNNSKRNEDYITQRFQDSIFEEMLARAYEMGDDEQEFEVAGGGRIEWFLRSLKMEEYFRSVDPVEGIYGQCVECEKQIEKAKTEVDGYEKMFINPMVIKIPPPPLLPPLEGIIVSVSPYPPDYFTNRCEFCGTTEVVAGGHVPTCPTVWSQSLDPIRARFKPCYIWFRMETVSQRGGNNDDDDDDEKIKENIRLLIESWEREEMRFELDPVKGLYGYLLKLKQDLWAVEEQIREYRRRGMTDFPSVEFGCLNNVVGVNNSRTLGDDRFDPLEWGFLPDDYVDKLPDVVGGETSTSTDESKWNLDDNDDSKSGEGDGGGSRSSGGGRRGGGTVESSCGGSKSEGGGGGGSKSGGGGGRSSTSGGGRGGGGTVVGGVESSRGSGGSKSEGSSTSAGGGSRV